MGCGSSKPASPKANSRKYYAGVDLDKNLGGAAGYLPQTGPLTAKDYKSRLTSSEGTQSVHLAGSGFTIRYAYLSQRGYYPDSPDKPNQDSFAVHTYFGGDPEQHLFGVFDGHGEFGTQCSQFCRDKMPENLLASPCFVSAPDQAFHQAMVTTNNQLHRSDFDDSMSGTTAVAVLMRGRTLYVANVGDSRAVLAERVGDRLVAVDLSVDQTPYRQDECERVKRCGARVLTLDQLEGLKDSTVDCWTTEEEDDGDPPRLWFPNGTYPGTAFTRSIGDSAAERIGVYAEPEMLVKPLTAAHAFLVIASDGVFEFVSSQSVIDMISKFDDLQEACYSVVAESYRLWLQFETRTDDITMIVVQFFGMQDVPPQVAVAGMNYNGQSSPMVKLPLALQPSLQLQQAHQLLQQTQQQLQHLQNQQQQQQHLQQQQQQQLFAPTSPATLKRVPTRRLADIESSLGGADLMDAVPGPPPSDRAPQTPEELAHLEEAVRNNFLFVNLSPKERQAVFARMHRQPVKVGDVVIHQGDMGNHFFVVEEGRFEVCMKRTDGQSEHVHTYAVTPGAPRPSFGELALLYAKPRAASVVALTDGALWQLHRQQFKAALQTEVPENIVQVLRTVEILQPLSWSQLVELAGILTMLEFETGQYIIRQGADGDQFFMIEQGQVCCMVRKNVDDPSEPGKEVLRLSAGQYFGERALLGPMKRPASVVAQSRVVVKAVSRALFEAKFGPLQDMMDSQAAWLRRQRSEVEIIRRTTAPVVLQGTFSPQALIPRGNIFSTDYSVLARCELPGADSALSLRIVRIPDVITRHASGSVTRARTITRMLPPSLFVPHTVLAFQVAAICGEALPAAGLCTLSQLLEVGPLDEGSASFLAASVVLGLEHLHWCGVSFRGLSAHTAVVAESGLVQLVDMRFAKVDQGRTYTLCGAPEYLSPEQVAQVGHTAAADWWALGVLICALLSGGDTPFAIAGDDELRIYKKITYRVYTLPPNASPAAVDLMTALLTPDPAERLGASAGGVRRLKAHPWFSGINWEALQELRSPVPLAVRDRMFNMGDLPLQPLDATSPYEGNVRDLPWVCEF